MPHTLFISDLHLDEQNPTITARFFYFIKHHARQADALYVLGDCFEAWIGDDDLSPFHLSIIHAFKQCVELGTPVYFMHGNRDFLIGERFAQMSGATLIKDPSIVELYGKPVLLSHGDRLCTLDVVHQVYRNQVSKPWVQKIFLSIPIRFRRTLAKYLRRRSHRHNQQTPLYKTDVIQETVIHCMRQHQAYLLIHGHTHRPHIHSFMVDNINSVRIVLGAWHNYMSYLIFDDKGGYELKENDL